MLTLLLLFSCAPEPTAPPPTPAVVVEAAEPASNAAPTAATTGLALGEPFEPGTPVSADALVAAPDTWSGKAVVVEGTVAEVCQKKGCWHTIATSNPDVALMVKDKEYKIFLPKDAAGHKVLVNGLFAVSELPEEEARHYAEDAGKDPSTIVGPQKRFTLDVSGVRFL